MRPSWVAYCGESAGDFGRLRVTFGEVVLWALTCGSMEPRQGYDGATRGIRESKRGLCRCPPLPCSLGPVLRPGVLLVASKVVLVRRKNTGVLYAMKILKKVDVVRKRQVERTKIERRVLGNVEHPFLMRLHYAFQVCGRPTGVGRCVAPGRGGCCSMERFFSSRCVWCIVRS